MSSPSTRPDRGEAGSVGSVVGAGPALAARAPLLSGAALVTFIDVDDAMRETHGYAKQGVGYGYSGVKGLDASIATVSPPQAAQVIAAIRLRKARCALMNVLGLQPWVS